MATVTEQLQELINRFKNAYDLYPQNEKLGALVEFKQRGFALIYQRADSTEHAPSTHYSFLDILTTTNHNGQNNQDIERLVVANRLVLTAQGKYGTPLQTLLDEYGNRRCSFDTFKRSAMLLAEHGAILGVYSLKKHKTFIDYHNDHTIEPPACHTLFHVLVRTNKNGQNNDALAKLIKKTQM